MKAIKDICYSKMGHPEQYLDIYLPEQEKFDVFVYIHGGGIEDGDKRCEEVIGKYLTEKGIACVSINYRMYPQARYPEFICDSAEAVGWVYKNIGQYGECTGMYIGGTSAGGYLTMMLCFDEKYLKPYNIPEGFIKGYVHDAGQPTVHFNVLRERGLDTRRVIVDEAAPLYHIGNAQSYSPMLFIVSDNDMEGRFEQTQLVLTTLKHFGYDQDKIFYRLEHGTHCHYAQTPKLGEFICEFIEKTR